MQNCKLLTRALLLRGASSAAGPQLTHTPAVNQQRGLRDDLRERGIEWRKPKEVPFYHPEKHGDLEPYNRPDKTRPVIGMRLASDEYDEASPKVQQLLSLEFAPEGATLRIAKYDAMRLVQRHQYDTGSITSKIACLTCFIRMCQTPEYAWKLGKYAEIRVLLNERINLRKRLLTKLRSQDYKYFEWLLEKLNILYKPNPMGVVKLFRYESLAKLVRMRCQNIRKRRMAAYRSQLQAQREDFEKEKFDALTWIKKTQEELGITVDVDPETGMIERPEERKPTIWQRVFGPFLDK